MRLESDVGNNQWSHVKLRDILSLFDSYKLFIEHLLRELSIEVCMHVYNIFVSGYIVCSIFPFL